MYIGVISMRYAKALLAYADEKGTEDTVYEEAGILADSFSRIPELRQASVRTLTARLRVT